MKASKILIEADESIHLIGRYRDVVDEMIQYCALGLLGCKKNRISSVGGLIDLEKPADILQLYGIEGAREVKCPVCCLYSTIGYVGVHLNDDHAWTFKQIGEWLSQYEPC